jgi:hypothetical protein
MTFKQALKELNIEDFGEEIFNSNSHGELMHLQDYINIAAIYKGNTAWFRDFFLSCVEFSATWKRPSSVYQHIATLLTLSLE